MLVKRVIEQDIKVYFVEAVSFPGGIQKAFDTLNSIVPSKDKRNIYGLSRPEHGKIIYRAAAEVLPTDNKNFDDSTMIIPAGTYISIAIKNFMNDIPAIGKAFQELICEPNIDPNAYCVEWYEEMRDVVCMVKLA